MASKCSALSCHILSEFIIFSYLCLLRPLAWWPSVGLWTLHSGVGLCWGNARYSSSFWIHWSLKQDLIFFSSALQRGAVVKQWVESVSAIFACRSCHAVWMPMNWWSGSCGFSAVSEAVTNVNAATLGGVRHYTLLCTANPCCLLSLFILFETLQLPSHTSDVSDAGIQTPENVHSDMQRCAKQL